jgi:enamine deaminase RidA (YjgF/YER057c/UK114 family)
MQPRAVPKSSAPIGQVVIDDSYVHLSGLVAYDFPAGASAIGDVGAETRAVLTTVRDILQELGMTMDRIVRVDVHLADLDEFDAMNAAYREFFEPTACPARTTTQSPKLIGNCRVEITCMARR